MLFADYAARWREQVPAPAEVFDYGEVEEGGRPFALLGLRSPGERTVLITAGFHGDEKAGPLTLLEHETMQWNAPLWSAMAWSVLALTLGGSSLLYLLIQRGAATEVTSLLYLVPPCTALMAWIGFDEIITPSMWLGMVLCATAVFLVRRG